jgi:long-chain acyl-CoA synthetase
MKQATEAEILQNIKDAHTVRGISGSNYQVAVSNFAEWSEELTKKYGTKPALVYLAPSTSAEPRTEFTYQEFIKKVNRIANFLYLKLGLRRGECVAVLMNNHPDMLAVYLATFKMGGMVCPLTPGEDEKKNTYILQNAAVKIAVGQDEFIPQLLALKGGVPSLKHVIKIGEIKDEETLFFRELISTSSPIFSPRDMTGLDDDAMIVYTSGTAGLPKGVILSQYNLLINARNIAQALKLDGTDRTLSLLPLSHVNEVVSTFLATFSAGNCLIITDKSSPGGYWSVITSERVTLLNLTPSLLQEVFLQYKSSPPAECNPALAGLKYFICGEGALTTDLVRQVEETTGVKVIQGYGLTETAGYITLLPGNLSANEHKKWMRPDEQGGGCPSVGVPLPNSEITVMDEEGRQMPAGRKGEMVIRSHSLMKGYHKRPEANAEAFKYGWFHTGDEGFYLTDKKGQKFFFISGRFKDVINRAGMKISPQEVETVLYEVPGVKWGLIIGFNNKWTGEEVGAFVIPESSSAGLDQTIINHITSRLGFYKAPKVVVFGKEISQSPSGDKRLLRQQLTAHFQSWNDIKFESPCVPLQRDTTSNQ